MDLTQAICDNLGYKMEIKNIGFDALIPALKSGQIDVIAAGMDATPERKKQVAFTDVYYKGGYTIVVRKDNTDITGYDTITGKTVGAQVASKAGDHAKEHGATSKEFDTNSQGGMELEAGTVDAISIVSRGTAMAISKDKPELLKQFNDALSQIKKDGTYAKIYKKWFGEEPKDQDL